MIVPVGQVQFFSEAGFGPDVVPLGVEPCDSVLEGVQEIAPRAVWIVVGPDSYGAPTVSAPGAYKLQRADAAKLRDLLTSWLDEGDREEWRDRARERLAARRAAVTPYLWRRTQPSAPLLEQLAEGLRAAARDASVRAALHAQIDATVDWLATEPQEKP